jgi:malonyl-CoA O-methyltransferase
VNKSGVARQFGRASSRYAQAAGVQRKAAGILMELLPRDLSPASILDLGCGDGEHAAALARRWPKSSLTAVDLSPGMLRVAGKALENTGARLLEADMDDPSWWRPEAWDLIFSNMALQWSTDGSQVVRKAREGLRPGGYFALGVFLDGTFAELGNVFASCGARLLPRPGLRPGAQVGQWLAGASLSPLFAAEHREVERFPNLIQVLGKIRDLGATTGMEGRLTPGLLRRLERCWRETYPDPLGLPLTWHYGLTLSRRLLS